MLELISLEPHDWLMQLEPHLNWSQLIGVLSGSVIVMMTFLGLARQRRRMREKLVEKPPQREKLLRPAGYYLQCRIQELNEEWSSELLQAICAGAVTGFLISSLYPLLEGLVLRKFSLDQIVSTPNSAVLISTIALAISSSAWSIKAITKSLRLHRELRNYQFGLRGEQAVTEALTAANAASGGYQILHDVPGDGPWNIDHVLIARGGIFVLETKTRSRRRAIRDQPEHEVRFDGEVLTFPWGDDRNAVQQVRRNAEWVRSFISGFTQRSVSVQPIVVVPGWFVKSTGNHAIKAMNAKYLATTYLSSIPAIYSDEELRPIIRRFDERCRTLEF